MTHPLDSIGTLKLDNLDTLRQLVSELPVACLLMDKEHRVLVWNKACASATGYPAEKMLGTTEAWRAFYPEKRPTLADLLVDGLILQELQTYYSGQVRMSSLFEGVIEIEAFFPMIGENGRWLYATVAPVRNPAGEVIGALEILQDVDSIRLAEQRTSTLFNATPDAMLVVDPRGVIIMANKMAETCFGYSSEELIGLPVDKLVPQRYRGGHAEQRQNFMQRNAYMPGYHMGGERQLLAVRRDNSEFPAEIVLNRVALGNETVVICAIRDVTVQRRIQQELRDAKEEAEAATKAKSEFLANMSHEIRTPMNAVIGLTKLAMRGNLPERESDYVRKAHAAAEALLGILNDVLDFSKIEAGQLNIDYTLVDLGELLDNLLSTYSLQAQEKNLQLTLAIADNVPKMIECDPLRLTQVLGNLCSNAIKFTDTGSVSLSVALAGDNKTERLVITVADTGIGLTPAQQARLFQSFSQADSSISRQYGGTGLGLAISKRLLAMMNGDIHLESSPGNGTRIQISLPVTASLAKDHRLSEKRILIIEDNDLNREQMAALCRWFGMAVTTVPGGLQARMEFRKAMLAGTPFDILLVDWLMPEEDGLNVIKRMHQEFTPHMPPVVLVTSAGLDEASEAITGSGVQLQGLITKPLHARRLSEILTHALSGEEKNIAKGLSEQSDALRNAHILLVDDNDLNRLVAHEWLDVMGTHTHEADSGMAALDILNREPIDAVLMDCQMPDMDGLETTRRIRANPRWAKLPVIALSASAMDTDIQDALASGMNDYLSKPVQEQELQATLARWLKGRKKPDETSTETSQASETAPKLPQIPGLNSELGLQTANNKPALYLLVLTKFAQTQQTFSEKFSAALEQNDPNTAQRLVHTLKSGLGYIGAEKLASEAAELENALRKKHDVETIQQRFGNLAEKLTTMVDEIVRQTS